ncbi:uncharacterized protein K452DRAFT_328062 [Aplosporella prunicola CBS 121167]|uniref:Vacuolar import and degradation protein-domain-containing protein n=1 Tax=Aplosporella prunicola CBS 121167 TaxID=1176127 RepID=A0A6A6B6W3_9PEZI|nr:uncharacterized protein K452DRAFT_328062 [Aplosporella prunicola CBS 121167]KAF2139626.1 hypothetical protein K452DRAFT_328062 [Aplosporella prunicola CBS 121167]
MPPPSSRASPQPTPPQPRPSTPPSYLSALRQLESPVSPQVINLAATLTTQAEDAVDEDNVSFLRRPVDPQEEWRQQNAAAEDELYEEVRSARERLRQRTAELQNEDRERQLRLSRVLNRLSRMEDAAYGDRIPTRNTLYDWSPPDERDGEDEETRLLRELRQQQPNTHPDILTIVGRSQLEALREARSRSNLSRYNSNTEAQPSESSLRSTQSRRYMRTNARARENMQRYVAEREAASRSSDRPQNPFVAPTGFPNAPGSRFPWHPPERSTERQDADARAIYSYRRNFLENPSGSNTSQSSPWLEQTIKYLSKIRSSDSYDDSLYYAVDAGFVNKEFFGNDNHNDFILDVSTLPRPAETSWLAPGAVFSGSQHATTVTSNAPSSIPTATSTTLYRFRNNETPMTSTTFDPSRPWMAHSPTPPHPRRTPDAPSHQTQQQDRWPVKVTIHAVDWENMTLSATMEAYNVPSHPPTSFPNNILNPAEPASTSASSPDPTNSSRPPPRTSSITTYLEGEILDLHTHTLLTESFKSSPSTDATYWRKLPPFAHLRDQELVHSLVSHEYVTKLAQEWILMRWKERCFVKSVGARRRPGTNPFLSPDSDEGGGAVGGGSGSDSMDEDHETTEDGCGLTISGFYYVCLRRSDGAVEGLYYDPQSSPYQHLRLNPVGGGSFPVWSFR